ncbi:Bacterial extracellular solute-binding protein [compost metagenome]
MSKRLTTWLLVILLTSIVLTACSSTPKQTIQYEGDSQMQATITVMYSGGLNFFNKDYGDLFRAKYPNIEVKVVTASPWSNIDKVLEEQKPDVLLLSYEDYVKLMDEGKLLDLNNVITDDAFNLEGMNQEIIGFLRQSGGGKLYGLPPYFGNHGLFYNKDLFDKYNIPYPQDGMTWEEVFQLAKRFPVEDGISGFYKNYLGALRYNMEASHGLKTVNPKEMKVTINTESYKKLFETLVDVHQSKTLEIKDYGEDVYDSFITGKSAMTLEYYYYLNNNIYWAKTERGDDFHLNWDVVTTPVSESNREAAPMFMFYSIYAVNANTSEAQAAWELVKFINSEEVAKMKSRTTTHAIPTRTDYMYNPEGKRMEIFYKNINMDWSLNYNRQDKRIPNKFNSTFTNIMNSEFMAASRGEKSVDEALQSIQERGQKELDKQLAEKSVEEGK